MQMDVLKNGKVDAIFVTGNTDNSNRRAYMRSLWMACR